MKSIDQLIFSLKNRIAELKLRIDDVFVRKHLHKKVYFITQHPSDVQRACQNLTSILSMVPFRIPDTESGAVMKMQKSTMPLFFHVGQWLRFRRGLYKGDIGLVCERHEFSDKITVYVIPRICVSKASSKRKKLDSRPAPRIFDPEEVQKAFGRKSVLVDGPFFIFDGQRFEKGLLRLVILGTHFVEPGSPSDEELVKFHETKLPALLAFCKPEQPLKIGEKVTVIRGTFVGLKAVIENISDKHDTADVSFLQAAEHLDQCKSATIPLSDLSRHYTVGSMVQIVLGVHKGRRGMIVIVRNSDLDLLLEGTQNWVSFAHFRLSILIDRIGNGFSAKCENCRTEFRVTREGYFDKHTE